MRRHFIILLLLFFAISCMGQVINVAKDESGRVHTIQEGIDLSSNGDTVVVYPGIYESEEISFGGRTIIVRSSDPNCWETIKATVISGSMVSFVSGETNESVLEGFTVSDSNGIYCEDSSPTIRRCYITNNWSYEQGFMVPFAWLPGGGIRLINDCDAVVEGCVISGNTGSKGSGVYIRSTDYINANSKFINCTITNNNVQVNDDDIYYDYPDDCNNLRYQVDCTCARPKFINCIIYSFNYSFYGTEPENVRSLFIADPALVKNSCVNQAYCSNGYYTPYSSGGGDYYDPDAPLMDLTVVNDNINEDPGFVNPLRFTRTTDDEIEVFAGDYHLKGDSACVDGGTLDGVGSGQKDIDGDNFGVNNLVDIGADEFCPELEILYPATNDVWIGGSKHLIGWETEGIRIVDIYFSDDNCVSWELVAEDQLASRDYLWTVPGDANSEDCFVKIELNDDPNIAAVVSGRFSVREAMAQGTADAAVWPMLGRDCKHRGKSDFAGPKVGDVKCNTELSGKICGGLLVDEQGYVVAGCENGMIYRIEMNPQSMGNSAGSEGVIVSSYNCGRQLCAIGAIRSDGVMYWPGKDGTLMALDSSYELVWQNKLDGEIISSPVIDANDNAYVGTNSGKVYSVGVDGSVKWCFDQDVPGAQSAGMFASASVGDDGSVYMGRMRDPNLYALDPNDGSVKWAHRFAGAGWPTASPMVGDNGTVYVTMAYDPNLYLIDSQDGVLKCSTNLCEQDESPYGDFVLYDRYYNGDGYVDGYYGNATGEYIGEACFSEMAMAGDGTVYVNFNDPFLRAVDSNGVIKWVRRLGMNGGFDFVVDNDGFVFAACDDGYLCVVDAGGQEVARFKHEFGLSSPVLTGWDVLVVADANNNLISLSSSDANVPMALHHRADINGDNVVNFKDFGGVYNMMFKSNDPGWKNPIDDPDYGKTIEEHYYNFEGSSNSFDVVGTYPHQYTRMLERNYEWFFYDEYDDYSEVVNEYKVQEQYLQSDINRDWYVDMYDFFEVANNWLNEN